MKPPSRESTSGWTAVLLISLALVSLGLLAGQCNGNNKIIDPLCSSEAFARGLC